MKSISAYCYLSGTKALKQIMRVRYKIKTIIQFVSFAFYPRITILVCLSAAVVIDIVLGVVLNNITSGRTSYDIILALMTGATTSFFVAIIVELANNYRHNKLAWFELHEYYSAVNRYEMFKQVLMKHSPHQRAKKKAQEEAGYIDEFEEPKDVIEATWEQLPNIMPIFKDTLENKKAFLSDKEINALESIVNSDYKQIWNEVHMLLMMSPLFHNVMNHPDEEYIDYPRNIKVDMPAWVKKHIAQNENQKALNRLTDEILSDSFLMNQLMERHDISQEGIDNYDNLYDEQEIGSIDGVGGIDDDYEKYDFYEPEDEDEFIALHNEQNRVLIEEQIPFVSWHISNSCKEISENIDVLEEEILKKPYYSIHLKFERGLERESLEDPLFHMDYTAEKKRLERIHKEEGEG